MGNRTGSHWVSGTSSSIHQQKGETNPSFTNIRSTTKHFIPEKQGKSPAKNALRNSCSHNNGKIPNSLPFSHLFQNRCLLKISIFLVLPRSHTKSIFNRSIRTHPYYFYPLNFSSKTINSTLQNLQKKVPKSLKDLSYN